MQRLAQILVCVALIGCSVALKWKDCGSVHGKVTKVEVKGCESSDICNLPHNQNVSFSVDFTPDEEVTKGTTVVHGVIAGIPIPFPVDDPNACDGSAHIKCPLEAQQTYTYATSIFVKSMYPKVKLVVKWEMTEQNGQDVFCIELPAQIVDSQKKDNRLLFNSLRP